MPVDRINTMTVGAHMLGLGTDRTTDSSARLERQDGLWVVAFALAGVVFQIGLFLLGNTALRMPLRIGIFGLSLAYLLLFSRRRSTHGHSVAPLVQLIAAVLVIGLINPNGAGLVAGLAQATLYVAVLAPLIWVAKLQIGWPTFRRLVLIIWGFHTASAALGALQIKYPGTFDGATSNMMDDYHVKAWSFVTADGRHVVRPKGLTDVPGGAGSSGVYSVILGMGLLLTERSPLSMAVVIASMGVSLFSIYLSQGRTNLVLVAVAVLIVLATLLRRGDRVRATLLLTVLSVIAIVGTSAAFAVGGKETVDRWGTLTADDPRTVAYKNRGIFLDELVHHDLLTYPVGAGGGRWGMMNVYFGNPARALWAEMMWQALLYDGGIPLIVLYSSLLIVLVFVTWRMAVSSKDTQLGSWAAAVLGFDIATIAGSFVFPIYIKDVGLQMFLLNAGLFALAQTSLSVQGSKRMEPVSHGISARGIALKSGRTNLDPSV